MKNGSSHAAEMGNLIVKRQNKDILVAYFKTKSWCCHRAIQNCYQSQ